MVEDTFWYMSIDEVYRYLYAYKRKNDEEVKQNLFYVHTLAGLIGNSVSRLFSKNDSFKSLYETFPEVFKDELVAYEEMMEQRQIAIFKEQMKRFAAERNRRLQKQNNNNTKGD